jgi:hypothetical protein
MTSVQWNDGAIPFLLSFVKHTALNLIRFQSIFNKSKDIPELLKRLKPANSVARPVRIGPGGHRLVRRWADAYLLLFPSAWRNPCLYSSLTILDWLHSQGIRPDLNVGLNVNDRPPRGHAWLSFDDVPIFEIRPVVQQYSDVISRHGNIVYRLAKESPPAMRRWLDRRTA